MNYPFDRHANLIFVAVDLYGLKKTHFDLPPTSLVDGLLGLNFFRGSDLRINFKEGYISLK